MPFGILNFPKTSGPYVTSSLFTGLMQIAWCMPRAPSDYVKENPKSVTEVGALDGTHQSKANLVLETGYGSHS